MAAGATAYDQIWDHPRAVPAVQLPHHVGQQPLWGRKWGGGGGGLPRETWSLYDLICGFLRGHAGPWAVRNNRDEDNDPEYAFEAQYTVQNLVIDVCSATEDSILPIFECCYSDFCTPLACDCNDDFARDPQDVSMEGMPEAMCVAFRFAHFMCVWFDFIIGDARYGTYGNILLERIGDIEIKVDGEKWKIRGLSTDFACLGKGNFFDSNDPAGRAAFFAWKRKTSAIRRAEGFKMVEQEWEESDVELADLGPSTT